MTPPAMTQNWNMVPALQCHIYPDFEFANVFDPDEEDFDKIGQHSPLPIPKEIFQETVSPSEAGASANGEEEEEDKEQNREDDESTGIVMEKTPDGVTPLWSILKGKKGKYVRMSSQHSRSVLATSASEKRIRR